MPTQVWLAKQIGKGLFFCTVSYRHLKTHLSAIALSCPWIHVTVIRGILLKEKWSTNILLVSCLTDNCLVKLLITLNPAVHFHSSFSDRKNTAIPESARHATDPKYPSYWTGVGLAVRKRVERTRPAKNSQWSLLEQNQQKSREMTQRCRLAQPWQKTLFRALSPSVRIKNNPNSKISRNDLPNFCLFPFAYTCCIPSIWPTMSGFRKFFFHRLFVYLLPVETSSLISFHQSDKLFWVFFTMSCAFVQSQIEFLWYVPNIDKCLSGVIVWVERSPAFLGSL